MDNRRTYTYDVANVNVLINGIYLTGFSDNSKVSISKNEDNVAPYVGVDGEVSYSKNNDKTGTASFSLANTSPHIPMIRSLATNQVEFELSIIDLNEYGKNISAQQCRIIKVPDYIFNKEVESLEFDIYIPYLDI